MIGRIRTYSRLLRDILLMPLMLVFPRKRNKIVFGAWFGHQFAGNPKYLLRYLVQEGGYECVWVGDENIRKIVLEDVPAVRFVVKGSWAAWWQCFTARFYICNVGWRYDVIDFPRFRRVVVIDTTHGVINKRTGPRMLMGDGKTRVDDDAGKRGLRLCLNRLLRRFADFAYGEETYGSTSSEFMRKLGASVYPKRFGDRLMAKGQPCIDYLVHNRNNANEIRRMKKKYAKLFGISPDKKWYLYVPTWRHAEGVPFSFSRATYKRELNEVLKSQNAILIDKEHPKTLEKAKMDCGLDGELYVVSPDLSIRVDIQELMLACDRLISDYSSIYYDYAVLNRPVIEFTYDYDFVTTKEFGLEFDLREYAPGPFAYNEMELIDLLKRSDRELLAARTELFFSQIDCERGRACEALEDVIKRFI